MAEARTRLLVLLVAYFLVRVPFLLLLPTSGAPDEDTHLWMIDFLGKHWRLPEAAEVAAGGATAVYGSYPPLGYLPHIFMAFFARLLSGAEPSLWHYRLGSLFIGSLIVPCADYSGRLLFKKAHNFALALPLLVVFHPQLIFVNSYANCDSTTAALGALTLVLLMAMIEHGLKIKLSLILGLTLAWLALTKYSGYALFPAAALAMALAAWLHRLSAFTLIINALVAAATTIALSLWWFLRNAAIFDGDYLGTRTMYHTWALTYKRELDFHKSASTFLQDHRWWRTIIYSYWGYFGYMTIEMARPLYIVYQAIMSLSLIAALTSAAKAIRTKSFVSRFATREQMILPAIWLTLTVTFVINLGAMVYASMANYGLAQGRYLFPSELAIMAMLLGGLYQLPEKIRSKAVFVFLFYNVVVCLYVYLKLKAMPGYGLLN